MIDEPLLLTLPLMEGESTFDFLSRLAARNGVATMARFCKDQGLSPGRIRDGCPVELARLSKLSGVPVQDLEAGCIRKVAGGFMLRGHRMVVSSVRRHRFRVCPACLGADIESSDLRPYVAAYGRLAWKVGFIRTCPEHNLGLTDIGSGSARNEQDFTRAVRMQVSLLGTLSEQVPRRPASELESYVLRRIDGLPGTAPFLDGMELHAAARFCEVVGAFALHGRGLSMNALGDHDWYLCGAAGIGIAGYGEDAIRSFLTGLQRAYPYGHRVKDGPRPPFADFQSWLNHRNDTAYAPARDLLARHVAETLPDVVQDKPRIPQARLQALPAVPGMPRKILVTSVRPRRIEPSASLVKKRSFDMNTDHAAAGCPPFDPARHDMLTPTAAAAWLGCDASLFVSLQAHGYVTPKPCDGDWRHAFERGQLDDLQTQLLAGAEPFGDVFDAVSIAEAANCCSCTAVEIVHLLLAGEVSWQRLPGSGNGIASLRVRTDAIRALLERKGVAGPTLRGAMIETGLKPKVLLGLISMGAMSTSVIVDALTRNRVTVIQEASYRKFFAECVSLDDIKRYTGSGDWYVRHLLKQANVLPLFIDRKRGIEYYRYEQAENTMFARN